MRLRVRAETSMPIGGVIATGRRMRKLVMALRVGMGMGMRGVRVRVRVRVRLGRDARAEVGRGMQMGKSGRRREMLKRHGARRRVG